MSDRDFTTNPYSPDEQRIVDWLLERSRDTVGAGDDPISFVLASYEQICQERNLAHTALKIAQRVCGQNNCNCRGALNVKRAVAEALKNV